MENIIYNLQVYIQMLLVDVPKSYNKDMLDALNFTSNKLKILLATNTSAFQNEIGLREQLNFSFKSLISLSDQLWTAQSTIALKDATQIICNLVDHIYERYKPWLTDQLALPLYRLHTLEVNTNGALQSMETALQAKHIPQDLVLQITKAITDLFKDARFPPCSFAQEAYLSVFIPQLKALATDPRSKDWTRRLKQLLIKYNFNAMGIFKFLAEERKTQLLTVKDPQKVLQVLHDLEAWLQQLQAIPFLAFQAENTSLKNMLLKEVTLYKKQFIEQINLSTQNIVAKLAFNSSVHELSLIFHYYFDDGMFNYKTKKEAAIAISEHVQSKETNEISTHSLIKFDKLQLNNAALKLYQRNKRMQEKLVRDFDL